MRTLISLLLALAIVATVTVAATGLIACGQKGQLYLPPPKKAKVPATAPTSPQQPQQQPPAAPSPSSTTPASS
jgi:predicted small lipoprotein YifL